MFLDFFIKKVSNNLNRHIVSSIVNFSIFSMSIPMSTPPPLYPWMTLPCYSLMPAWTNLSPYSSARWTPTATWLSGRGPSTPRSASELGGSITTLTTWAKTCTTTHSSRCWATGPLEITLRRRSLAGLGSFWLRSTKLPRRDCMWHILEGTSHQVSLTLYLPLLV